MHGYANPARFLKIARPATGWLLGVGVLLLAAGIYGGLFVTPADYLQGESARIMYLHVPSAWMSMFTYVVMAVAAGVGLVWRIKLAHAAAAACAPIRRSMVRCSAKSPCRARTPIFVTNLTNLARRSSRSRASWRCCAQPWDRPGCG